jgi:hypothetical protein
MSKHVPDDFPINGLATQKLLYIICDSTYDENYRFGENREPLSNLMDFVYLIINGDDFGCQVYNLLSDYGGQQNEEYLNDVFNENFEFSINKRQSTYYYVQSDLFDCFYSPGPYFCPGNSFKKTIKLIYPYCELKHKLMLYYTQLIDDLVSQDEIKSMFEYSLKMGYYENLAFIIVKNQDIYENFYINNINKYPKEFLYTLYGFYIHSTKQYQKYFNIVFNKLQIKNYKFVDYKLIELLITRNKCIICNFDTLVNFAFINSEELSKILNNFKIAGNILIRTNLFNETICKNSLYSLKNIDCVNIIVKYLKSLYKDKNKIIIYRLDKRFQNGCKYSSDIIQKIKS